MKTILRREWPRRFVDKLRNDAEFRKTVFVALTTLGCAGLAALARYADFLLK